MRRVAASIVLAFLVIAPLTAKGRTVRVELRDIASGAVSQMTDRAVLDRFNVWDGPGTYSGNREATTGFIVDWQAGAVDRPSNRLRRYELRFFVEPKRGPGPDELAYVVLYEHDAATGRGYVYLPGQTDEHFRTNVRSISRHGLEGHWFNASAAWQTAFATRH